MRLFKCDSGASYMMQQHIILIYIRGATAPALATVTRELLLVLPACLSPTLPQPRLLMFD